MHRSNPESPASTDHVHEAQRLAAVVGLGADADTRSLKFDDLATLAAELTGQPLALVSVMHEHESVVVGLCGCELDRTPREIAICRWTVQNDGVLEIPDCRLDERTSDNPQVANQPDGSGLRFYAGVPLQGLGGEVLGTLCVCAPQPTRLTAEQRAGFERVARIAESVFQGQQRVMARSREIEKSEALLADRETRLRGAQSRLDRFAVTGSAGSWETIEPDGAVYFSPRFKRLLGYTNADDISDTREAFFALVHPDDLQPTIEAYHRLRDHGEPYRVKYRLRHRNGTYRWYAARADRFFQDGLTFCSGSLHDINEAQLLEQRKEKLLHQLDNERRRLHEIIEINPHMLFWKDRAGVFLGCNRAAAQMLGVDQDELAGKTDEELNFPPDQIEAFRRDDQRVMHTGQAMHAKEEDALMPDGQVKVLSTSKIPMRDADGQIIGVLGISEDVTERKRSELDMILFNQKLVRATGELEAKSSELKRARDRADAATAAARSANEAKTEFLANMSHEIRTPMSAILGFAELLRDEHLAPAEHDGHIDTIRRNGEHLMSIINEILDLSKIEAGQMKVERLPIDLPRLLGDVVNLMKVRAVEKGLDLSVRSTGPVPATIFSDPLRFRQILLNLASNAVKFTERGRVEIECELMPANSNGRRMLRVFVHDTGIGMDPSTMGRLFQTFEQADSSTTRRFGGSGLGLAISRRLAALLGGSIFCTSAPEKGSTFCLFIDPGKIESVPMQVIEPIVVEGAVSTVAVEAPKVPTLRARVLLAEDGADNLRLLAHHLEAAGLDMTYVPNGREAVAANLQAEQDGKPFDCVLMDMQMPIMDGYTATRKLRQQGYDRPVAALTAHAMAGDKERCIAAGCSVYLTKPVDPRELYRFVEGALQHGDSHATIFSH